MKKTIISSKHILLTLSIFFTLTVMGCAASTKSSDRFSPDAGVSPDYENVSLGEETTTSTHQANLLTFLGQPAYNPDAEVFDHSTGQVITYKEVLEYIQSIEPGVPVDLHRFDLTIPMQLDIISISDNTEYLWNINIDNVIVDSKSEEIDISGHNIATQEEYTIDEVFSLLPDLKRIDMCNCGYTNDEMAALCDQYTDVRIIWEIHLSHWDIRTDRIAFSTMKDCSQTFFMTDDEAKYFKYCTDLVALDIGHNHVGDISFLQYLPNLRILILVDNVKAYEGDYIRYTDDLSVLQYLPELRYLEFFVGSVKDLSFLQYTPKLVDLNISYNPVYDATPLYNLPNLERLMMEHTNIPYEDYVKLQETYPNAQIEYYGEGSIDHGWREHPRYFIMRDMFNNNYLNDVFK